jgi:hypothetical protein
MKTNAQTSSNAIATRSGRTVPLYAPFTVLCLALLRRAAVQAQLTVLTQYCLLLGYWARPKIPGRSVIARN